jgi:hypothetical protein
MTIRTSPWPAGTPCWADISVADVDAACAFYAAVLGWHIPEAGPDDAGYRIALVDGHPVAAIGPQQSPDQPQAWLLYLATEDADATVAAIAEHGGTLLVPPFDAGRHGRLAVAADPTGAMFAIWQADQHLGAELVNAPGGMTWEDLRCTDPSAAHRFYASVFNLDMQPIEMAPEDYRTFHLAGSEAPMGGIGGFMGPAGESHWAVYFGVADAGAAVRTAEQQGGSIAMPAMETPFGRMAGLADPTGAIFQIVEMAAETDAARS